MANELTLELELVAVVWNEECSFEVEVCLHLWSNQVPRVLGQRLQEVHALEALQNALNFRQLKVCLSEVFVLSSKPIILGKLRPTQTRELKFCITFLRYCQLVE